LTVQRDRCTFHTYPDREPSCRPPHAITGTAKAGPWSPSRSWSPSRGLCLPYRGSRSRTCLQVPTLRVPPWIRALVCPIQAVFWEPRSPHSARPHPGQRLESAQKARWSARESRGRTGRSLEIHLRSPGNPTRTRGFVLSGSRESALTVFTVTALSVRFAARPETRFHLGRAHSTCLFLSNRTG
jgi:hypothetical protein